MDLTGPLSYSILIIKEMKVCRFVIESPMVIYEFLFQVARRHQKISLEVAMVIWKGHGRDSEVYAGVWESHPILESWNTTVAWEKRQFVANQKKIYIRNM